MQRARIRVQCRSENGQAHKRRAEYCELLFDETGLWVSQSTMCRTFQRLKLPRKKRCDPAAVSAARERAPRQNTPPHPSPKCPKGYRFA